MSEQALDTRYLGYSAAAKYLGVSVGTLRRWVDAGKVHSYKVGEWLCRFDREELDALVRGSASTPAVELASTEVLP